MSSSISLSQEFFAKSAQRDMHGDSKQYVHHLATIVHSEPVVERCIEVVTSHTLAKGIACISRDGAECATPEFSQFVNKYYTAFARDAIRMFYILGFVVWRIGRKRIDGVMQKVPQVVPLGTFTWSVQPTQQEARGGGGDGKGGGHKRTRDDDSLLFYDVRLSGVECDFFVFEFCKPDMTMHCVSPLSSVISNYIRLQVTRACKMRCDEWNASVRVAVEVSEKMQSNQLLDDGTVLQGTAGNPNFDTVFADGLEDATGDRADVIRKQARDAQLPSNTHMFVLPKNHTMRPMDRVERPEGVPESELDFQRMVCYALGVPCNLVMQSYSVSTTSSASGTSGDSNTYAMQMLKSTCTRMAHHITDLLQQVYTQSYLTGGPRAADAAQDGAGVGSEPPQRGDLPKTTPVFHVSCNPTLPLSDIVELHFRQLVHDDSISEMMLQAVGFPLDKGAVRLPWNKTVQPVSEESPAVAKHKGAK